jgi:NADH:ubiquinone oxidoreductase subunit E
VATIDDILKDFSPERRDLIMILHRVQAAFGYVPRDAIQGIARHLNITENDIYGVLTFYAAFSLAPKGRYVTKVCLGTACHVRGGAQIAEEIGRELSLAPGQTTPDRAFTLETVNCLGCCAIGPVVLVNEDYHGHVGIQHVRKLLDKYRAADAARESGSQPREGRRS